MYVSGDCTSESSRSAVEIERFGLFHFISPTTGGNKNPTNNTVQHQRTTYYFQSTPPLQLPTVQVEVVPLQTAHAGRPFGLHTFSKRKGCRSSRLTTHHRLRVKQKTWALELRKWRNIPAISVIKEVVRDSFLGSGQMGVHHPEKWPKQGYGS